MLTMYCLTKCQTQVEKMDAQNIDELVKKMHEEKGNTVEYLRNQYSDEQLDELTKEVSNKIFLKN